MLKLLVYMVFSVKVLRLRALVFVVGCQKLHDLHVSNLDILGLNENPCSMDTLIESGTWRVVVTTIKNYRGILLLISKCGRVNKE